MSDKIWGNAPDGAIADAPDGTPKLEGDDILWAADDMADAMRTCAAFLPVLASEAFALQIERWATVVDSLTARIRELEAEREWKPIETAPKDGTEVLVWAQLNPPEKWHESVQDLPPFVGIAAYHPDAGWCVCTMREVTHWQCRPKPPPAVQVAEGSRAAASPPTQPTKERDNG